MTSNLPNDCNLRLGIEQECEGYTCYDMGNYASEEPIECCKNCRLLSLNMEGGESDVDASLENNTNYGFNMCDSSRNK